jgi:hypothetical protein
MATSEDIKMAVDKHADRAVDQLSNDVRVPGVALGVRSDVHHDVMEGHGIVSPPPHVSDGVQSEFADRLI